MKEPWISCKSELPPEGELVETIIADARGPRNESELRRRGSVWFVPDYEIYVYYTPTHWRRKV